MPRRCKGELGAEPVEEFGPWSFPDANRAVALDVAMTSHRAEPGARLSDLPTKQMQIDDLLDVGDCIHMLGEPHSPTGDRALGLGEDVGGAENLFLRYSAGGDDPLPR